MLCHWRYVLDHVFGAVREPELPRRDAHHQALGRGRKALRGDRRGRRLRHLHAGGRRGGADQLLLADARLSRRSRHLPGRRHARLGGRRAAELQDPAAHGDAAPGLESRREARPTISAPAGRRCPTRRAYRERLSRVNGRCSSATSSRMRRGTTRCSKAPRACSSPSSRWRAGSDAPLGRRAAALARRRAARQGGAAMPAEPAVLRKPQGAELQAADSGAAAWRRYRLGAPSPFPAVAQRPVQPRRLRRRARGLRSARRRSIPGSTRRSTGTRRSPIAGISGRSASRSPRRWTRRSAAWGSTGRPRSS